MSLKPCEVCGEPYSSTLHFCAGQEPEVPAKVATEAVQVILGKPGDLCAEGDGRPSVEGFWCGACHMAAEREMESYAADRAEAGISECDWFERQMLEHAVVEAAILLRNGKQDYFLRLNKLNAAVDALVEHQAARDGRRD